MRRRLCIQAAVLASLAAAFNCHPLQAKERPSPTPSARVITLEEAYDIALATDQNIRIAYDEIRKANLLTWSALTKLGPQLSVTGEYDRPQTHASGLITTHEYGTLEALYTQPFVDFSVFPAYHYGKLAAVAARLQHQYTIRQTLFGVVSAYYQILTDEGIVQVDQKTVDLAAEQLQVAQKRLDVGEVTPTDALNAQVTLEQAKVALIAAKNTLLMDRDTLGNILNLGGDTGFQVTLPPDYPNSIPPFQKLLAIAYRNREDLEVGNIAIGQDVARKGEVVASYGPTVVGEVADTYTNARGFYGPQAQVWDANVVVSLPIFTGGQREIDLRTDTFQIDEDQLNRDKIAKNVEASVRQAWLAAERLQETLRSLRVQVDAARESYKDEQAQYAAGTAASVDVLVALVNLNTSENSLAEETYLYQVALRDLEEAAGVFQQQRVDQVKVK